MPLPNAVSPDSGFDYAPGTMNQEEQRAADSRLLVQFFNRPVLDEFATNGGIIYRHHPRLKEFRDAGYEIRELTEDDGPGCRGHWKVEPAGRPIYKSAECIRIIKPGDRDTIIERLVEPQDRERFARQYMAFKNAGEAEQAGTPLKNIPFVTPEMREELAFFHVVTAEQLVGMADNVAQKFLGANTLRQRVKLWLEATKDSSKFAQVTQALEEKEGQITDLKAIVAELQKTVAELASKK